MFDTIEKAARPVFAVLAVAGAIAIAAPGLAAPPAEITKISVNYTDLDLTTGAGIDTLYRRIVAASKNVCPQMPPGRVSLAVKSAIRDCRETAVEHAVAQIGNPRLAAVHREQARRG